MADDRGKELRLVLVGDLRCLFSDINKKACRATSFYLVESEGFEPPDL